MVRLNPMLTVLLLVLVAVVLQTSAQGSVVPDGYDLVAQNNYLELYIDRSTTEIAVVDKLGSEVWFSNPLGLRAGANLTIGYYTPSDALRYMNSHAHSADYGQFQITPIESGVRIDYKLGREWEEAQLIPVMISQERFEEHILANLTSDSDRSTLLSKYQLVSLIPKTDDGVGQQIDIYRVDLEQLFGEYELVSPGRELTANQTKSLIDRLVDTIVDNKQSYRTRDQVTHEDVAHLEQRPVYLLDNLFAWDTSRIAQILESAGYTYEDAQLDHTASSVDPPKPSICVFEIPLLLRLEGAALVASVPADQIIYPDKVENDEGEIVSYPLHTLDLLPYLGVAPAGERGYMFVPDGTGGLIHFDRDKSYATAYNQSVYGIDQSIMPLAVRTIHPNRVSLPVFGMKRGIKAMVAMIEEGEAFAAIRADVPRNNVAYSQIYPQFTVLPVGKVEVEGGVPYLIGTNVERPLFNNYPDERYQGNMQVRYEFMVGEEATYVGMAVRYREYLEDRYNLRRLEIEDYIPFYLELIGGIDINRPVLGAPRSVVEPMTTYQEAAEIVAELLSNGVRGVQLKYTGWMRGGYRHVYPSKVSLERALGSRSDYDTLVDYLGENGVRFFPEVSFTTVYQDRLFDGFRASRDAAFQLDTEMALSYEYDLASNQAVAGTVMYSLSPMRIGRLVDSFLKSFRPYEVKGIALRHAGSQVHSDFHERRTTDRQAAVQILRDQIQKLRASDLEIMVDEGNEYALAGATHIVNLPLEGTHRSKIVDETVPFYQIALHGLVYYAGNPLNYSSDYTRAALKCVETGAYPFFQWIYRDNSVVKGTTYDYLLSVDYRTWLSRAAEFYTHANQVLRSLQNQMITNHQKVSDSVFVTSYENGAQIVVNYGRESYHYADTEIPGESFVLIEGVR